MQIPIFTMTPPPIVQRIGLPFEPAEKPAPRRFQRVVEGHADGVLQMNVAERVHRVDDAYVNWYLVEDGDALTVVDTGHPRSWRSLEDALFRLGKDKSQIAAVVLTHGHFDHVGFAERARTELGVPVLAPREDIPVTRHPMRYDHERSRVPYMLRHPKFDRAFAAMAAMGALRVPPLEEATPYDGGQQLDVPGRPTAVATPGHTYGHCSLHFADRGVVIAGDALVTYDPYTASDGPRIVAAAATADSDQALASLDALAATGARTVLPGHGDPWTAGAATAADRARAAGPS
jgi:glyoxylase-like metal-dependent hydrolase (beta-lactamase superfamily II)